ncbi:MAG TPA: cation diffusion facilitator family transporter [Flavisolibacter sp.]|nr:cation diffusion facilitator family transporter [Flavisolibacter sp.]
METHHHDHGHDHLHSLTVEQASNKAFQIGILLNLIYVIVELISGFLTHSLALISDAGHNFSDVVGLALSLLAFKLARIRPTAKFTYGYKKTTILVALVNAVILLVSIGILGFETVVRLAHPIFVEGGSVALIAAIGIVINALSALMFYKTQKDELNAKAAYLHLMVDALVSVGVVVAGIIIKYTGWYLADPLISLIILIVILAGTWRLLTESLQLSLDAVPKDISLEKVQEIIVSKNGVDGVHHIHVWAMSTTENALTAHVIINQALAEDTRVRLIKEIKHDLLHYNIQHATLEIEVEDACKDKQC